jgi:hypothetical protein
MPNRLNTSTYAGQMRQARAQTNRAVGPICRLGPRRSRYVCAMTKPESTKNRSTPRAPEVISGPSTPTTSATPGNGVKWKWNSTTHAAATIRRPVSPRSSPAAEASPVAAGRGFRIVTVGERAPDELRCGQQRLRTGMPRCVTDRR